MLRLAWRSLMTRPIRAAVLAAGFGFGIAVMVALLGVGQVILEQAHAPALAGGGDLIVQGPFGPVTSARFTMATLQEARDIGPRVRVGSLARRARVYLVTPTATIPIVAIGGVPSLEKAIGDQQVAEMAAWADAPGDQGWAKPQRGDVLRTLDRFHPIAQSRTASSSWAEWLYFNARTRDGRTRLYLTFLVGPPVEPGMRQAGVRLQLERDGRSLTYSASAVVDEASVLAHAPDLDIAGNRVRLDGSHYRITLVLPGPGASKELGRSDRLRPLHREAVHGDGVSGEIVLDAASAGSLPPTAIHGAGGWVSGYVVPVLSGPMRANLRIGGEALAFDDAIGYHDHNWGFWEGVRWQWGQVAHDDISIVYGRVFPPVEVADPGRIPGFLAVLGPDGPLGFSSEVSIDDATDGRVEVRARGGLDLRLTLSVTETVQSTAMGMTRPQGGQPMDFLQLGGLFRVTGQVGARHLDFTARGSAETFKSR